MKVSQSKKSKNISERKDFSEIRLEEINKVKGMLKDKTITLEEKYNLKKYLDSLFVEYDKKS